MDNKKISIAIVLILLVVLVLATSKKDNSQPTNSTNITTQTPNGVSPSGVNNTQTPSQNQAKNTLYFTINDEENGYMGEVAGVDDISVVIDTVQAYNGARGWVTFPQTTETFDLSKLKTNSQTMLLAQAKVATSQYAVPANTYSIFKFHLAKVLITMAGHTQEAILPAHDFVINTTTGLVVYPNTNSAAQFNLMALRSLHQTDNGEFVFTPIVEFDSRINAAVQVGKNNVSTVSFGQPNPPVNAGMDVDGKVKIDFALSPTVKLSITSGIVKIGN